MEGDVELLPEHGLQHALGVAHRQRVQRLPELGGVALGARPRRFELCVALLAREKAREGRVTLVASCGGGELVLRAGCVLVAVPLVLTLIRWPRTLKGPCRNLVTLCERVRSLSGSQTGCGPSCCLGHCA